MLLWAKDAWEIQELARKLLEGQSRLLELRRLVHKRVVPCQIVCDFEYSGFDNPHRGGRKLGGVAAKTGDRLRGKHQRQPAQYHGSYLAADESYSSNSQSSPVRKAVRAGQDLQPERRFGYQARLE